MAPASRQERGSGGCWRRRRRGGAAAVHDGTGGGCGPPRRGAVTIVGLCSWSVHRWAYSCGLGEGGRGIFIKIHIQLCPAWEGLFAIFAPAIDLVMDVPRWLCAFVHQLRLVHGPLAKTKMIQLFFAHYHRLIPTHIVYSEHAFSHMYDSCKMHVVYTLCDLQQPVHFIVHLLYCRSKVKVESSKIKVDSCHQTHARANTRHVP
jgi:hypothetical protein